MDLEFVTSRKAARAVTIALAWFAFAWAVARACVQAVTGDEAQDYIFFAAHNDPGHWTPAANNHMLNSMLERMFTSIFGLSALTVRLPTLIGAAIYIYLMYRLCQAIGEEWKVRIPVFVCLVYNPFIFDFFVAARGYGIANAFLMSAIAVSAAWHLRREYFAGRGARELIAATTISSGCLGVAFTANFSLTFTGATTMLLLLVWAIRAKAAAAWKLLLAGAIPGLAVVLLIPSWTLLHFPRHEIVAGTKSLKEMLLSLVDASRYRPSPFLINPLLWPIFDILYRYLIPAVIALAVLQLLWILRDQVWLRSRNAHLSRSAHSSWLCALGTLVISIAVLAVAEHRLAYRLTRLLMPVSRTALFLLPLVTLAIGIAAAIPALSPGAKWGRRALIGSLYALGVYYFFCMRLTYFQEWDYQQDLKEAYKVLACYNHEKNVQDVESSWEYHAGMNFQRLLSGRETFGPFSGTTPHTTGHEVYVLERNFERDFVAQQGLKIVYEGPNSGIGIAVRADLADEKGGACYVWPLP
jgi:hypothetical protein